MCTVLPSRAIGTRNEYIFMSIYEANHVADDAQGKRDWRSLLIRDRQGKPCPFLTNCVIALQQSGEFTWQKGGERRYQSYDYHPHGVLITPFGVYQFETWKEISSCRFFLASLRLWLESQEI